jgi:integrase
VKPIGTIAAMNSKPVAMGHHPASPPALYRPDTQVAMRTLEFFTAHIRNPATRKAYAKAAERFADWCAEQVLHHLRDIRPMHVAAYIEGLQVTLAALRILFDWLVVGQIIPTNPASSVRGPKHSVKKGTTSVLTAEELRTLLDAWIPVRWLAYAIGHRRHAVHLRPGRCRAEDAGGRYLHAGQADVGPAA